MNADDYEAISARVIAECTTNTNGPHGRSHWERVERIGSIIASRNGANPKVVQLFSVLHDSKRLIDGDDPGHGERAAEFAASLRSQGLLQLPDEHFELLDYAIRRHTDGQLSDDATVGACWDADRLDLMRVGTVPRPEFMSTTVGRGVACNVSDKAATPGEGPKSYQGPLYTIDSRGLLKPGLQLVAVRDVVELFNGGLLSATLTRAILARFSDPGQAQIELTLETVRSACFRQFPSRQICLFACDCLESLQKVSAVTNRTGGVHGRVFELTGEAYGPFDGFTAYLRRGNAWDRAMSFWRGNRTSDPLGPYYEYLVAPPITVGRQVGTI